MSPKAADFDPGQVCYGSASFSNVPSWPTPADLSLEGAYRLSDPKRKLHLHDGKSLLPTITRHYRVTFFRL